MQLDDAINSRRSIRDYTSKTPDWRTIIECIDAMRFAPMAGNDFSLKFILVSDLDKIKKLAEASQQDFVADAKFVVVVCTQKKTTVNAYGKRGELYARQQAGSAIQNFLLKITEAGLATCWIGHFVENIVKRTLGIPPDIDVEAFFPIGYEKGKPHRKRKPSIDNILYFDVYKNKKMKSPNRVD